MGSREKAEEENAREESTREAKGGSGERKMKRDILIVWISHFSARVFFTSRPRSPKTINVAQFLAISMRNEDGM